jgi:hypothetical protein
MRNVSDKQIGIENQNMLFFYERFLKIVPYRGYCGKMEPDRPQVTI